MRRLKLKELITILSICYLIIFYLTNTVHNITIEQHATLEQINIYLSHLSTPPPGQSRCPWSNNNKQFVTLDSPEMSRLYPVKKTPFPNFNWSNVVVLILTYNDPSENKLIQKHFDSWIKHMPKGLDIIFVTDNTDPRNFTEALPDANNVPATIHLYHSSGSRGEGSLARKKALDAFKLAHEKYKDKKEKQIFLKLDPDTYVIPQNLLKTIKYTYKMTYPLPLHFGRVDCTKIGDCFSLGASYGFNKNALAATVQYINTHPEVFDQLILRESKLMRNLMRAEDFFFSHVFHEATCLPTIHISGMSIRLQPKNNEIRGPREEEWDKTKNHVTIHFAKKPEHFDRLDSFYYDANGQFKPGYELTWLRGKG